MITTFERRRIERPAEGSVVSIGVFDGVHLGHLAILRENVSVARELGAVPTVVTFRRHPKRLLLGHAPKTLTTLEHRIELFRRAGIGHTVALTFDEGLRGLSAAEFVQEIAVLGLGVKSFVLGFDSKFGHDRDGTPDALSAGPGRSRLRHPSAISRRDRALTASYDVPTRGSYASRAHRSSRERPSMSGPWQRPKRPAWRVDASR